MTEDDLPPFHPDKNRQLFPNQPRGIGNPEWFLTPEEVTQLSDDELNDIFRLLYAMGDKGSMNSLYGATNLTYPIEK